MLRERSISFWLANLSILTLPLYTVRFHLFGVPSTVLEVMILLTASIWSLELVLSRERVGEIWKRINSPIFYLALSILVVALVSVYFAPDKKAGLGLWRAYFLEPILLGSIVLEISRRLKSARWFIYSLLGSGLWIAILALSQFVFHAPLTDDSLHEVEQGRSAAVFNSANALALYLGPLLAVSLIFSKKIFRWILPAIFLLAILTTQSLGSKFGLGALGVVLILYLGWPQIPEKVKTYLWKSSIVTGLVVAVVLAGLFFNISKFTPQTHFTYPRIYTDTKTIRLCLWEGTQHILAKHPLTGTGLSGFRDAYFPERTCDSEPLEYPHNIFLNFWVETGIVGLILFIALQVRIFMLLKRSRDRWAATALAGAFIYWIIHGLVDVPYFKNDLAVMFWVLAALAIITWEGFALKENKSHLK